MLRALPPKASLAFSESHDAAIAACVTDLFGLRPQIAQLPFQQGRPQLALLSGSRPGRLLGFPRPGAFRPALPGVCNPTVALLDARHHKEQASLRALLSAGLSCLDGPDPIVSDVLADRRPASAHA